jgi:NAD(P)-dependent dehydrogenase (short-subunit alcohol dehydrogenase family)
VHAIATVPRLAAYAASKGAVLSLSRQMALDYADDGIRVNAVVGSVDTQMSAEHGVAMARDGVTVAPGTGAIGRSAQPGEVARAVAFLTSPESSFLTGPRSSRTAGCWPGCSEGRRPPDGNLMTVNRYELAT